jgi:hypothetical protein
LAGSGGQRTHRRRGFNATPALPIEPAAKSQFSKKPLSSAISTRLPVKLSEQPTRFFAMDVSGVTAYLPASVGR